MKGAAPFRFRPVVETDLPRIMEIEAAGFLHPWSEALLRAELGHAWSIQRAAVAPGPDPAGGSSDTSSSGWSTTRSTSSTSGPPPRRGAAGWRAR